MTRRLSDQFSVWERVGVDQPHDPGTPLDALPATAPNDLYTWAVRHSRWRTDYEEAE